ncbi:MAG: DUF488 domain-containing protein [Bacillota bacterium]
MVGNTIYTIGHSNHSAEYFLKLLKKHNISAVVDVRSSPYSRRNPQYKYKSLETLLNDNGIAYVYLGKELGARPKDPNCYIDGRVSFKLLAESSLFKLGIDRIIKGMETYKIAIMCAEKEPLACHRTILVSQYLFKCGISIFHILASGQLESHEKISQRLLDELGMQNNELFRSRNEVIDEAFAKREQEIAST